MSSGNQQNPSNQPQEHEKIKRRIADIVTILFYVLLVSLIIFGIYIFIEYPNNIFDYKELCFIVAFLLFQLFLIICLAKRLEISFFANFQKKISSNSILNMIILSCLISACSFNSLITTSNEIINEIETQNLHNDVKNTIKEAKCGIENKIQESQSQSQSQTQKTITQQTQQNKDINGGINTRPQNSEINSSTNTQEQDKVTNNKCNIVTVPMHIVSEDIELLGRILGVLGTASFGFLSAYLFVVKGKVEDYLDYIDEQNS